MKEVAENLGEGAAFVAGGAAGGAATSATVGGMGLAGGFGAVGIGTATVVGAGAVAGAAAYGAFKAIGEGDAAALGAMGIGAVGGAGVSSCIGGMRLVAPKIGLAVGIGTAPIAAAGALVGLAAYGIAKLLDESGPGETAAQVFERMEEKVSSQDAYFQAMMELDPRLAELDWNQKFAALEIEEELQALKAQLGTKIDLKLKPAPSSPSPPLTSLVPVEPVRIPPLESQHVAATEAVSSLKTQPHETWKCVQTLKGHSASVNSVALSPDGLTFASGSDDKTVSWWNLKTGKRIFTFFGCSKGVSSVALSPDGQMVVSGDLDRTITTWKLETKAMRSFCHSGSPYSHSGYVYSVAFSPDGQVASGSADNTIKIWNLRRWTSTRTLVGHSDTIWSIAISPDGKTLASGSADNTIGLWSLNSWKQPRMLIGHSGWVNAVAFSPDGQILASGGGDATVRLWNFQTGELICTLTGHSTAVISIAISPDGHLASSSRDGIIIWNLQTRERLYTLSGRGPVAFSPDGKTLVSGGEGGTIKIWRQTQLDESTLEALLPAEWWEVLDLKKGADLEDVKRVYRRLARQYHPDVNCSANAKATMQALNGAYKEYRRKLIAA